MRLAGVLMLVLALVLLGLGCAKIQLPSEQAMSDVFAPRKTIRIGEEPPPASIPLLPTSGEEDWRKLCETCHVGPHFSSYTVLHWGHRDSCVQNMKCRDCHSTQLHRPDVRGDKAKCIECHMDRGVSIACSTCHSTDWRDKHDPHPPHGQTHVMGPDWQEIMCLKCHGSERWCTNCHGLTMPHPKNIVKVHPGLVQGRPEVCARCHGTESCTRCHRQAGVKF